MQIRFKPNSFNIAHFPIKNYDLHLTTTLQNQFIPTIPHTYFCTRFRTTFIFNEVFTDDKPNICATIIQNSTNHIATLPTGHIGYIEVPITNEKPKYYQVKDINTLINNVTHTYHPEITEFVPQTNYSLQSIDKTVPSYQVSINQLYVTDQNPSSKISPIYNVQPTPHISKPRIFPSLPYTAEILDYIKNSTSNSLMFQIPNMSNFVIFYLSIKHAMQHIKMMLAKVPLHSLLDLNLMLNLLHNVLPKYQFITEIN